MGGFWSDLNKTSYQWIFSELYRTWAESYIVAYKISSNCIYSALSNTHTSATHIHAILLIYSLSISDFIRPFLFWKLVPMTLLTAVLEGRRAGYLSHLLWPPCKIVFTEFNQISRTEMMRGNWVSDSDMNCIIIWLSRSIYLPAPWSILFDQSDLQ